MLFEFMATVFHQRILLIFKVCGENVHVCLFSRCVICWARVPRGAGCLYRGAGHLVEMRTAGTAAAAVAWTPSRMPMRKTTVISDQAEFLSQLRRTMLWTWMRSNEVRSICR